VIATARDENESYVAGHEGTGMRSASRIARSKSLFLVAYPKVSGNFSGSGVADVLGKSDLAGG
jgi:predicted GNAT family acetyltransferase